MTLSNDMGSEPFNQHSASFNQQMTVFYAAHILQKPMWLSQGSITCVSEISKVFSPALLIPGLLFKGEVCKM